MVDGRNWVCGYWVECDGQVGQSFFMVQCNLGS